LSGIDTENRSEKMQTKIYKWLERLPDTTHQLVLRAGDTRSEEVIIEKWTTPFDDLEIIIESIIDAMGEEIQGRLIAYTDKAKQLRSLSLRSEPRPTQTSDTGMLVEGILRMAEEQRRFVATITDSFQVMHETIQDAIFVEREHHEEMADAQLGLALAQMDSESKTQSTTDKALSMFAQVLQAKSGNIDMKKTILDNPSIIDGLLDDEEIIDLVMQKFANRK
jgi:hypothetical protein